MKRRRRSGTRSTIPFVDFLFVHLLKARPLQVSIGMLEHVERFRHYDRAANGLGLFDPLGNEGLLGAALAMTFRGAAHRQISQVLEHPQGRNRDRMIAVERHVVEESLLAGGPCVFGPHRVAQSIAGCGDLALADLANVKLGPEWGRCTTIAAEGRIAGAPDARKSTLLKQ